jgi:putative membrane protein
MDKTQMRYYQEFCDDMILRDYLALDRTILANKRTLLSYARTFIGLIAGGVGMVHLVADKFTNILGYAFMALSVPIFLIGIIEYLKQKKALAAIVKSSGDSGHGGTGSRRRPQAGGPI